MTNHYSSKSSLILGILMGILLVVFMTALSVGLLLSGNWLYRWEIDALSIEETSGFTRDIILRNYDAVVHYLSPFNQAEFSMPDLPASESGISHFRDVKEIVKYVYYAGGISFIVGVLTTFLLKKRMGANTLLIGSITSFLVPVAVITGIALDFDRFFVFFHELFFSNNDWIFYEMTDPVITILPAEYFMHCGIVLAIFWLLGSLIFLLISIRKRAKGKVKQKFEPRY